MPVLNVFIFTNSESCETKEKEEILAWFIFIFQFNFFVQLQGQDMEHSSVLWVRFFSPLFAVPKLSPSP